MLFESSRAINQRVNSTDLLASVEMICSYLFPIHLKCTYDREMRYSKAVVLTLVLYRYSSKERHRRECSEYLAIWLGESRMGGKKNGKGKKWKMLHALEFFRNEIIIPAVSW